MAEPVPGSRGKCSWQSLLGVLAGLWSRCRPPAIPAQDGACGFSAPGRLRPTARAVLHVRWSGDEWR